MTNPFPGMDPYIEYFGNWEDFHGSLITEIRHALGPVLSPITWPNRRGASRSLVSRRAAGATSGRT